MIFIEIHIPQNALCISSVFISIYLYIVHYTVIFYDLIQKNSCGYNKRNCTRDKKNRCELITLDDVSFSYVSLVRIGDRTSSNIYCSSIWAAARTRVSGDVANCPSTCIPCRIRRTCNVVLVTVHDGPVEVARRQSRVRWRSSPPR